MRLTKKITLSAVLMLFCAGLFAQSSLKKANKQYELKAYNNAIKYYQKYLKRKPTNATALARIADSYRQTNQLSEAAKWYAQAVKVNRVKKNTYLEYGKVLQALGRCADARANFTMYASEDKTIAQQYLQSCQFADDIRNNPTSAQINNEFINTAGDDYAAIFVGDKIAYVSTRQDLKRADDKKVKKDFAGGYPNQLFLTERDETGFLRTPAFLHSDKKNIANQGPIAYSPDGQWVAFTKNNFIEGTRQLPENGLELGIYIASVEGNADFSEASPFPFNGKNFSTGYPFWGADSKTLYFASDRPDGFGGFDIYMSQKTGTSWSPPQNLGSIVNSKGNEITPFYDGTSLFFASDWHDGLGGYDIFRAEKSGKRFTNIYHTGTGINSSYDDLYYSYDTAKDLGYISSNRPGGKGGYDIYRIKRITINMVVHVVDENGKALKDATIDFTDCGEGVFLTDANGLYSFQVQPGVECKPMVRKNGFRTSSFNLSGGAQDGGTKKIVLTKSGGSTTGNNGSVVITSPTPPTNTNTSTSTNNTDTTQPSTSTPQPAGDFFGFQGRIINANTNVGLPNVTIRARRQSDGMIMTAESDNTGNYVIGLNPNTSYTISYSRDGYFSTDRAVRTGSTNDNILGTTRIKSTSDGYVGNSETTTYPSTEYPSNTGGTYPTTTSPTSGVSAGYAVQVAAVSADRGADLSRFNPLSDIGTVYYTPVGNVYKIRVGLFETADQARAAAQIIKSRGYSGAFTVTEGNVNINTVKTKPATTVVNQEASSESYGRYVVRLAAYSNPQKSFAPSKVEDLGTVAKQYKGQFTIILLTGYSSVHDAQRALIAAQSRGFTDAYVAQDINGELKKVK